MTVMTIVLVSINLVVLVTSVLCFRPASGWLGRKEEDPRGVARDARQSVSLLGAIRTSLCDHEDDLDAVEQQASGPRSQYSLGHYVERLRRSNREAGNSIEQKNRQLAQVLDKYGSLYRSERERIECYTQHVHELDQLLSEFEQDAEEGNRVLLRFVRDMVHENRELQAKVSDCQEQVSELLSRSARSERDARTDALTRLPNRRAWDEQLSQLADKQQLSIALLDIDDFKAVNDDYGHAGGDAMLTLIGTILRSRREIAAYRIGGDEFALLMPAGLEELTADWIRRKIASSVLQFADSRISTTVSIGVARRGADEPISRLVDRADESLYADKKTKGNAARAVVLA